MILTTLKFSPEMMNALSWTLIHSLWQGAVLAILTGILLVIARKWRAEMRYTALIGLFGLFLLAVGITYAWMIQEQLNKVITVEAIADAALKNSPLGGAHPIKVAINMTESGWLNHVIDWCNSHTWWIVGSWLLIIGLKCLQMSIGLWQIRRLCQRKTTTPPPFWGGRTQQLANQLQIRRPIQFLESAFISVPSTVGFFKPIILMPLGLLTQLPVEHIEAILLHELAHIRRNDYLVNLLQCVAEILFFFNPALLWLSTLIRAERENCCDDIALSAVENKTQYIKALLAFQEYHLSGVPYTLAFAESKTPLLDRIKRIINHHNTKKLSIMEKISLLVCTLLISIIAFWPLTKTDAQQSTTTFSQVNISGEGTEADPQVIFLRETDNKTYIISRVDQKVKEMYVNGQKIADEKIADYSAIIQKIDTQIAEDLAEAKLDEQQAKLDAEEAQRDAEEAQHDVEEAQRDANIAVQDAERAQLDAATALQDEQASKEDRQQAKRDAEQAKLDSQQAKRDAKQAKLDSQQAKRDAEQAKLDSQLVKRDAEQAKIDSKDDMEMQKNIELMAAEMVRDQMVSSTKKINSFSLSDTDFIVNGKKQREVVHEKYKQKYLSKPGFGIYYGNNGKVTGTGYFYAKKKEGL